MDNAKQTNPINTTDRTRIPRARPANNAREPEKGMPGGPCVIRAILQPQWRKPSSPVWGFVQRSGRGILAKDPIDSDDHINPRAGEGDGGEV